MEIMLIVSFFIILSTSQAFVVSSSLDKNLDSIEKNLNEMDKIITKIENRLKKGDLK